MPIEMVGCFRGLYRPNNQISIFSMTSLFWMLKVIRSKQGNLFHSRPVGGCPLLVYELKFEGKLLVIDVYMKSNRGKLTNIRERLASVSKKNIPGKSWLPNKCERASESNELLCGWGISHTGYLAPLFTFWGRKKILYINISNDLGFISILKHFIKI